MINKPTSFGLRGPSKVRTTGPVFVLLKKNPLPLLEIDSLIEFHVRFDMVHDFQWLISPQHKEHFFLIVSLQAVLDRLKKHKVSLCYLNSEFKENPFPEKTKLEQFYQTQFNKITVLS